MAKFFKNISLVFGITTFLFIPSSSYALTTQQNNCAKLLSGSVVGSIKGPIVAPCDVTGYYQPPLKSFDQAWKDKYGNKPILPPLPTHTSSPELLESIRQSDAALKASQDSWLKSIKENQKAREQQMNDFFASSDENTQDAEKKLRLNIGIAYKAVLKKSPSKNEMDYWFKTMSNNTSLIDLEKNIAKYFYVSMPTTISKDDKKAPDLIKDKEAPIVVDRIFTTVFGGKPVAEESDYWKLRARTDKRTEAKLFSAMGYFKSHGWTYSLLTISTK